MNASAPAKIPPSSAAQPPVKTWEVPSRFFHTLHTYYNESPWSPDQSKLAYLGVGEDGRAAVCCWDFTKDSETELAPVDLYDWHLGASIYWALDGAAIVYRKKLTDGSRGTAFLEVSAPGRIKILDEIGPFLVRHVPEAGAMGIGTLGSSIVALDFATMRCERLLDAQDVAASIPSGLPSLRGQPSFNHPVRETSSGRIFFKLMQARESDGEKLSHSFWVFDPATGLHCHGDMISGHPVWLDHDTIANIQMPRDGSDNRWLVAVDALSGETRRLIDNPFEGPSHLAARPRDRALVLDSFTADGETSPVYFVNPAARTVNELLRLPHRFKGGKPYDPAQISRSQPHPAWSPDGTRFAFNCNHHATRVRLSIAHLPPELHQ